MARRQVSRRKSRQIRLFRAHDDLVVDLFAQVGRG